MKTCQYCGTQIEDEKKFCTSCGAALPVDASPASSDSEVVQATVIEGGSYQQPKYQQSTPLPQSYDSGSIGWAILGFIFPLVGVILYFVWMREKPNCAKMSLYGALVSVGLLIVSRLVFGCSFLFW